MFTASRSQVATYLLGVCLFSISFLVFLNASVSFVITTIIGQHSNIGDAVGTLGFADELVAIAACPAWGALSDRLGVQKVAALGYSIIGLSLFIFVQARNIYPELLLARMFFSIGGAACTTMVTAILPAVTSQDSKVEALKSRRPASPSVSSELTITPARVQQQQGDLGQPKSSSATRVAGIVGAFTGCGALIALVVFLPLPTDFKKRHVSDEIALKDTFYVVGAVAIAVSVGCFFGLRSLQGERHKGWRLIWLSKEDEPLHADNKSLPYWQLLLQSIQAGYQDYRIGLGYLGGFVARASSVGISLFIPLLVNTYFISSGRCEVDPNDPTAVKSQCKEAYILSSTLTGISQLVALLCAPLFGFIADRYRVFEVPLLLSAVAGILGYLGFSALKSPSYKGEDGSPVVFVFVSLLGLSQIGAIVCSLGLLGRGISGLTDVNEPVLDPIHDSNSIENMNRIPIEHEQPESHGEIDESSRLLAGNSQQETQSLNHIQGSIAGTYSLLGGVGILILTKLGGFLFDSSTTAAPFVLMAIFNAILFMGVAITTVSRHLRYRRPS